MEYEISDHTLQQIDKRNITGEMIEFVIKNPDEIIDENGNKIFQSVLKIEDKNFLLRIFVNTQKEPKLIITAYLTSKIEKYQVR